VLAKTSSTDYATGWTTPTSGGGGGSGTLSIQEEGTLVSAAAATLVFGNGFDLTESPAGTANIGLDLGEYTGNTLPQAKVSGLGALASKNTVATGDIADGNVTNIKLAAMSDQTFKGNVSGGSAVPTDLTVTQMKTALSVPVLPVPVSQGGTGATSLPFGFILTGNNTGAVQATLAIPSSGTLVGVSDAQTLTNKTIDLALNTISGVLNVANGGSGRASGGTAYGILAAGITPTGTQQTIAPGTSGQFLKSGGGSVLASFGAIAESDVTNLTTDLGNKADKGTLVTTTSPLTGSGTLGADLTLGVSTFGTSQAGVVPASGGVATNFLCADGTWKAPTVSSAGITVKEDVTSLGTGFTSLVFGNGFDVTSVGTEATAVLDLGEYTGSGLLPNAKVAGLGSLATKSTVLTADITDKNVTYAKIQDISATSRVLGRITAGAGVTEELTAANLSTILGLTGAATMTLPVSVANGGTGAGTLTGILKGNGTGAVTASATVAVTDGGTGRATSTTAYGLIAAGTTATGAHQTIAPGTSGQFLKSAGGSSLGAFASIVESDVTNLVTDLNAKVTNVQGVTGIWTGNQAAYDAIGSKTSTTLYVIV
jgi:hypothetical protein